MTRQKTVLAYALTLKDRTGLTVTGDIYQLDYHTEVMGKAPDLPDP